MTTRPGQRLCASRRRSPTWTPSALAAAEAATTRLAKTTAAAMSAGTPAAVTGQSGHDTTNVRVAVTQPALLLAASPPRAGPHPRPPPSGGDPTPAAGRGLLAASPPRAGPHPRPPPSGGDPNPAAGRGLLAASPPR